MNKGQLDKEKIIRYWLDSSYDDYKMSFQKKCTPDYTNQWIEKLKEIRLWIRGQIKI